MSWVLTLMLPAHGPLHLLPLLPLQLPLQTSGCADRK